MSKTQEIEETQEANTDVNNEDQSDNSSDEIQESNSLQSKMQKFLDADLSDKNDEVEKSESPDNQDDNKVLENEKLSTPFDKLEVNQDSDNGFKEDDFDKETKQQLDEMLTDDHPGIKYKALRDELKAYKKKESEFKSNIENSDLVLELKGKLEAYEGVQGKLEEMTNKAALMDYTLTPEYAEKIDKPYERILEEASDLESYLKLDEDSIIKAIANSNRSSQDKAIEELTAEVPPRYARDIEDLARRMLKLYREEDVIKENAKNRLDSFNEKEKLNQSKQKEQKALNFKKQVNKTFSTYNSKIPTLIDDEGNLTNDYNEMLKKAESLDFTEMDDESTSFAAMSSVMFPHIVSEYKSLQMKLNEAKTLISQLKANNPTKIDNSSAPTNSQNKPINPSEKMKQFLQMDF